MSLDKDLKAKAAQKYDHELEKEVTTWIEQVTGKPKGDQEFAEWLKNGVVLCELVNAISPGKIPKVNASAMPFKQMENITYFMNAARDLGVAEYALFGTPDLYEAKNMGSVVNCVYAFGGVVQVSVPSFTGPKLGIAIEVGSKDKKREGGLLTDQSAGYQGKLELDRPTDDKNIRGTAQISPRPDGRKSLCTPPPAGEKTTSLSPRPAGSPRPASQVSPRPASQALAAGYSPDKAPAAADAAGAANATGAQGKDEVCYGLDAELKRKQEEKYDGDLEKEVVAWIEAITGEKKGDASVQDWLMNGRVLCALAEKLKPGSLGGKKVHTSNLPFMKMENITFFTDAARSIGVPESAMFTTPDLYEGKNIGSVVNCIYMLGGAVQAHCPEFTGPKLGVEIKVESKDKPRVSHIITDQSAGFSASLDVQKPGERADYCVKPVDR